MEHITTAVPSYMPNRECDTTIASIYEEPLARRPTVITLCGSTKFKAEFLAMLENLTIAGNIVLLPGYFGHQEGAIPISPEVKEHLDALHKRKIDMSDYIYVINKDGYIGESTRNEIAYAREHQKGILYYEDIGEKS